MALVRRPERSPAQDEAPYPRRRGDGNNGKFFVRLDEPMEPEAGIQYVPAETTWVEVQCGRNIALQTEATLPTYSLEHVRRLEGVTIMCDCATVEQVELFVHGLRALFRTRPKRCRPLKMKLWIEDYLDIPAPIQRLLMEIPETIQELDLLIAFRGIEYQLGDDSALPDVQVPLSQREFLRDSARRHQQPCAPVLRLDHCLHLTAVHITVEADRFFPEQYFELALPQHIVEVGLKCYYRERWSFPSRPFLPLAGLPRNVETVVLGKEYPMSALEEITGRLWRRLPDDSTLKRLSAHEGSVVYSPTSEAPDASRWV